LLENNIIDVCCVGIEITLLEYEKSEYMLYIMIKNEIMNQNHE